MAKKTESKPKLAAPAASPEPTTGKPAPTAKRLVAKIPPAKKRLPTVKAAAPVSRPPTRSKTAPTKLKAAPAKKKRTPKPGIRSVPAFTREEIALRAYFIAEKRQAHGWHGDEHQDWAEAERQLLAEIAQHQKGRKI